MIGGDNEQPPKLEVIEPSKPETVPELPQLTPDSEEVLKALDWMLGLERHPQMDATLNPVRVANVKLAAKNFIQTLLRNCPNSLDRMGAIRKVKEAMFLAESSIETPQVVL